MVLVAEQYAFLILRQKSAKHDLFQEEFLTRFLLHHILSF